jgi:Ca2+-binding RTX toxin-like protein
MAVINGTPSNDNLLGTAFSDQIDGLAGNDTLLGNAGNDILTGGLGTDSLDGGAGFDRVVETGDFNFFLADDKLISGDLLSKQTQTDTLISIEKATLTGGASGNIINASRFTGETSLNGLAGNDSLTGGSSIDLLDGGLDNDTLSGEDGNDILTGGIGDDILAGGNGFDRVVESDDVNFTLTDTKLTGNGIDTLNSIENADLTGGAGNNLLDASSFTGKVTLNGNFGQDTLIGGAGIDDLSGGTEDDNLTGGGDNDFLTGGEGNDTLNGDAGDDDLRGESGNDTINGGSGSDSILDSSISDSGNNASTSKLILTDISLEKSNSSLTEKNTLFSIEKATLFGDDNNPNIISALDFSGQANLFGGNKVDTLTGGKGNNFLAGGGGTDFLNGFGIANAAVALERDTLSGGTDNDVFILGQNLNSGISIGYSEFGIQDFATITDFSAAQGDGFRIGGNSLTEYSLVKQSVGGIGSGAFDTQIFRGNELIAVVQDNTDVLINRDFAIFG